MSLYNAIFGENPISDLLLTIAGVNPQEIPRFRDAYITDDKKIAIYTRTGGGNDECHCNGQCEPGCYYAMNRALETKQNCKEFNYDDYDSTYATFVFDPTEENKEVFSELIKSRAGTEDLKPSEKFAAFIDRPNKAPSA